ncbi:hypothetical protein [Escherichia phage CLB_P3]|nr:hypothetical protein BPP3_9 [Escherichia phage CLB_P3]UNI73385.1 hypothetical protein [Escherichia phage CLB_P3]
MLSGVIYITPTPNETKESKMSIKVENIIKHLNAKGRVVIKMDKSSGFISMTVTKSRNGNNVIGSTPGSRLVNATDADVRATLESNSIYINSWS